MNQIWLSWKERKAKKKRMRKEKPQFLTVNLNIEVMAYYFPGVSDWANGISHPIRKIPSMCQALYWVIGGKRDKTQWAFLQSRELIRKDGNSRVRIPCGSTCWEGSSLRWVLEEGTIRLKPGGKVSGCLRGMERLFSSAGARHMKAQEKNMACLVTRLPEPRG